MRSEGGDKEVAMSPEAVPPLLLQSAADRQMPVSPPSTVRHGAFGKETMWNKLGNGTGIREILNYSYAADLRNHHFTFLERQ